jgi:hypothetical protein
MRRVALATVAAMFTAGAMAAEDFGIPVEPAGWQVTHEKIGDLRWGMTRDEIVALFPDAEERGPDLFIQYLFVDTCLFDLRFQFGPTDGLVALEKVYLSGDHDRCLRLSTRQLNRFLPDVIGAIRWVAGDTNIELDRDIPFTFRYTEFRSREVQQ